MIYVDVTSACRSPLNTGVKRIQRGMHASLQDRADYRPLSWQSALRRYCAPSAADLALLEGTGVPRGLGYFDSFAPGFLVDRLNAGRDRARALDLARVLQPGDTLLIPDLLWDNRGAYLATLSAARAHRIGVFHDAIALRQPHQSRLDEYYGRRAVRVLAALDGVLCISAEAQQDLQREWQGAKVAPVATRIAGWPVPFLGARPATPGNFSARRLLYVARVEPHKNHLRLLEGCEMLWRKGVDFTLELIGCLAYPDAAWKILRRVRQLGKAGRRITWRAHVTDTELHAAYQACSATAFPSLIEGFGLPILESLWHGRPVICGRNGALGELAAEGGCETIDTTSVPDLAAGLRRVLTEERHYEGLHAEAVHRRFRTWPDYWAEIADFCRDPRAL